mgnify:CR=1 FL=1
MFTNWNRKAKEETRLNPLSIDDIDALTIATLRGMGTTPEKFRENVKQDMPEDAMEQGEAIMRRNPKVQMPDSHFKLQGAQEQQMMDDIELEIPEFHFDEGTEKAKLGVKQMARDATTYRALEAYKNTYKDHVMQAFDKHKAFMQSLGNQPMTVQEFMQHPKVPSFADYYKQVREGTAPGSEYADEHPFALTHPDEFMEQLNQSRENNPYGQFFADSDEMRHMTPFIPVITGEPMDLAMDALLKQGQFENAAQRRIYSEIPSFEDYGLGLKDVPTMRIMPTKRIESKGVPTFHKPIPLGGRHRGDPLPFERERAMVGAKHILDLPDVKTVGGTFVYPLDLSSYAPEGRMGPDVNLGSANNVTLGILDVPDWMAGQEQGRSQPEGYQIGGFDKDAYVRLDDSLGIPALAPRGEWFDSARRISPSPYFRHSTARPPVDLSQYKYEPVYNLLSQFPATTIDDLRDPSGYGPRNLDFLLEDWEDAKVASEPMDLAMDALLKNQPYHEMSKDQLDEILYGLGGYDAGTREYSRDETSSTQEEKDAAFQELLARQREADANPVNVFNLDGEEKSRLVDFYEPQFTGQNISPDIFIPQTEEEGQAAFDGTALADDIDERLLDIDEFMPGKSFLTEEDPMGKYHHLRATAGDDVAQNYLNRYRDFAMRNSENPEYVHQRLMQMFDPSQEVTAPQYTQEFPTDESIFNVKPPHVMMNEPDATGFAHNWQAKNASEPMDLTMDALLKRELHPGYPENMSIEDMINAGHDYPFNKDKYPDAYLANYPEEHIEEYGERPFNPAEPFLLEQGDQPLPVNLSQRDIDAYREKIYRDTLEMMNEKSGDTDNEAWAKWIANDAMPPVPQDSPLRMRRQVMVPFKDATREDVDAVLDMPDETGATMVQSFAGIPMNEETGFTRSEPMDLVMNALLKDLSPEAKRHKLEYDKKYESSPERVRYREELNRERRRRGIYGSGDHMDVSHTEGGKLTLEPEHDNRARHFKDKGTLRPSE